MVILSITVEEKEFHGGTQLDINISGKQGEDYATEREAEYVEKLVPKITELFKETANVFGENEYKEAPLTIIKRRINVPDPTDIQRNKLCDRQDPEEDS